MYITPRQWFDFSQSTDAAALRQLQANAIARGNYFKNPIFTGESFLWNNILIKKRIAQVTSLLALAFPCALTGDDAATTNVTAAVATDRAILLGAQALADMSGMSGNAGDGGYHFSTHTEKTDHGNALEHSICWMNGKAKIRFKGVNGKISDHGVMVLDTARS